MCFPVPMATLRAACAGRACAACAQAGVVLRWLLPKGKKSVGKKRSQRPANGGADRREPRNTRWRRCQPPTCAQNKRKTLRNNQPPRQCVGYYHRPPRGSRRVAAVAIGDVFSLRACTCIIRLLFYGGRSAKRGRGRCGHVPKNYKSPTFLSESRASVVSSILIVAR